jgi:hypothetical protein
MLPIESRLEIVLVNEEKGQSEVHSLLELAINNVGKYFEFSMRMCTKASARSDAVLINDAETAKGIVLKVLIPIVGRRSEKKEIYAQG